MAGCQESGMANLHKHPIVADRFLWALLHLGSQPYSVPCCLSINWCVLQLHQQQHVLISWRLNTQLKCNFWFVTLEFQLEEVCRISRNLTFMHATFTNGFLARQGSLGNYELFSIFFELAFSLTLSSPPNELCCVQPII